MKKLLLLVTSVVALVSCGGSANEASKNEGGAVELVVASGAVGQEKTTLESQLARFQEQNPNIKVKILETADSSSDRKGFYLQNFAAQSSDIDVYQIDVVWPGDLAEHLVDLNQYGAADVSGEHFEAIIKNNTVDGKLVAMPFFTDAGLLYYRKDLLEKYGVSAPKTWAELKTAATKIQEGERAAGNSSFVGYVWQGKAYEGLTCNALEWIASYGGGSIVESDGTISINNPKAVKALEEAASWIGTISPSNVIEMQEEEARTVWQSGNAAFMRNWPYAYKLSTGDDSAVKDKFGVSPLPAGDGGTPAATLGGWQLAVSKYSKNVDAAAKLVLFLTSPEEQKLRAMEGGYNPTVKSLYEDSEVISSNPFFKDLYNVFTNAIARPSTATAPNYGEVSQEFFNKVYEVLRGETDAKTAVESLQLELEDKLKK